MASGSKFIPFLLPGILVIGGGDIIPNLPLSFRTAPSHSEPSFVILNEVKNPTGSISVLFLLPRRHKNGLRQQIHTFLLPGILVIREVMGG